MTSFFSSFILEMNEYLYSGSTFWECHPFPEYLD
jgi:hypothetical protein